MKKYHLFVSICYLLWQCTTSLALDVQHILLDLAVDWQKKQIYGEAFITCAIPNANNQITLDAAQLSIQAITHNGKALSFIYDSLATHKNLHIQLERGISKKDTITFRIKYHTNYINQADPNAIWGSFGKGMRFFEPTSTCPNKMKQIWTSGEPNHNKYWFPCNEELSDLHTTEMKVSVEQPLYVIGNGNLVNYKEDSNGMRYFHYKSEVPFPNYLVCLSIGNYIDIEQQAGNTKLHHFG